MRKYVLVLFQAALFITTYAQGTAKLPALSGKNFSILRDSTTSMDVVIMQGKGSSLSLDGRNVHLFNSFFENMPANQFKAPLGGTIMWQINGREFISGQYFLGDKTGYVLLSKNNKQYIITITEQGNNFLKSQIKN